MVFLQGCAAPGQIIEPTEKALDSETEVSATTEALIKKPRPRPENYPTAPFDKETLYQLLVAEVAGYRG